MEIHENNPVFCKKACKTRCSDATLDKTTESDKSQCYAEMTNI